MHLTYASTYANLRAARRTRSTQLMHSVRSRLAPLRVPITSVIVCRVESIVCHSLALQFHIASVKVLPILLTPIVCHRSDCLELWTAALTLGYGRGRNLQVFACAGWVPWGSQGMGPKASGLQGIGFRASRHHAGLQGYGVSRLRVQGYKATWQGYKATGFQGFGSRVSRHQAHGHETTGFPCSMAAQQGHTTTGLQDDKTIIRDSDV